MKLYHPLQLALTSWQPQSGLTYTEYRPLPQLKPYIICSWAISGTPPAGKTYTYRALPDGCLDIVLNLDYPLLGSLCGGFTHYTDFYFAGSITLIGLRFHPGGFVALTGISGEHCTGGFLPVNSIGLSLEENLWQLQSIPQALEHLQQVIWCHFLSRQSFKPQMDQLIPYILTLNPNERVTDLATTLGYSDRQFRRVIRHLTGYAPKSFLCIMRFQQTLKTLINSPSTSTLDLALSHGYYDQSHLLHEFEELGGLSPQELVIDR
ncbi:MAG: helix-turn-helix domain-containing protein [Stenomitos rutilans HA7619-LM2]|jgi:AraC-like DNA-binding protein|nr:helix-turn-helix domain-containing protein [Stenomitos rutilans HA7619-LM2]